MDQDTYASAVAQISVVRFKKNYELIPSLSQREYQLTDQVFLQFQLSTLRMLHAMAKGTKKIQNTSLFEVGSQEVT